MEKQKNRGDLGRHSEITRVGVLLMMLAHVGRCWQMLVCMILNPVWLRMNLGDGYRMTTWSCFKKKSSFTNEQCSTPLLVDVVFFLFFWWEWVYMTQYVGDDMR
jgi:hypothetical protein